MLLAGYSSLLYMAVHGATIAPVLSNTAISLFEQFVDLVYGNHNYATTQMGL